MPRHDFGGILGLVAHYRYDAKTHGEKFVTTRFSNTFSGIEVGL
jgi:hypothetical protein